MYTCVYWYICTQFSNCFMLNPPYSLLFGPNHTVKTLACLRKVWVCDLWPFSLFKTTLNRPHKALHLYFYTHTQNLQSVSSFSVLTEWGLWSFGALNGVKDCKKGIYFSYFIVAIADMKNMHVREKKHSPSNPHLLNYRFFHVFWFLVLISNMLWSSWCVSLPLQNSKGVRMKIAVIGQSLFGQQVYKELRKDGHTIVGVFTIPDKDGKADPLGENFTGTETTKL